MLHGITIFTYLGLFVYLFIFFTSREKILRGARPTHSKIYVRQRENVASMCIYWILGLLIPIKATISCDPGANITLVNTKVKKKKYVF